MPAPIPTRTQAQRVYDKFGGVPALVDALKDAGVERNASSVYRWNMPRSKGGCGGVVPSSAMPDILAAARVCGLVFTPDENVFNPGRLP